MTPLAQKVARELTIPSSKRTLKDKGRVLDQIPDVHCFQISDAVRDMAYEMVPAIRRHIRSVCERTFLPAPSTWIEFQDHVAGRVGLLLDNTDGDRALVRMVTERGFKSGVLGDIPIGHSDVLPDGSFVRVLGHTDADKDYSIFMLLAWAMLAFINFPKVINRRQHAPHKGLARDLGRTLRVSRGYPLHAWSEIVLEVGPPIDMAADKPRRAWLTGARAQHFVRAHLRIRRGQLEFVSAHHRGDPALGIKRSRYSVVAV